MKKRWKYCTNRESLKDEVKNKSRPILFLRLGAKLLKEVSKKQKKETNHNIETRNWKRLRKGNKQKRGGSRLGKQKNG